LVSTAGCSFDDMVGNPVFGKIFFYIVLINNVSGKVR